SGSETFWRRHCHAIELIKAKSGPGKKGHKSFLIYFLFAHTCFQIRKAHTCSHCRTIMYPSPENLGYNHRQGFCADGAKQVSKTEPPPPWPQHQVYSLKASTSIHTCGTFLKTVKQIYKHVFLQPSGESPALKQEAFAKML
ncbi:hypothetical protein EV702DRAFT_950579, partial [Suillus placidus]